MSGLDLSPVEILILHEGGAADTVALAYGVTYKYLGPSSREDLPEIVGGAMLRLLDLGLIVFFRNSRDEGYNQNWETVKGRTLSRDEVVAEFAHDKAHPDEIEPEDNLLWYLETPLGRETFFQLPPDSVPRLSA